MEWERGEQVELERELGAGKIPFMAIMSFAPLSFSRPLKGLTRTATYRRIGNQVSVNPAANFHAVFLNIKTGKAEERKRKKKKKENVIIHECIKNEGEMSL